MNPPFDLAAWIEAKIQARRANKYATDLAQEVGCSPTSLRAIQAARVVPSNHEAAALAKLISQDDHPITADDLQAQQAARIAHRVNYEGRAIWPNASWAKALRSPAP